MVRSMDMNLSKLLVIVKSRGTWPVSMRLPKLQRVRYNLATEQQQQILNGTEIGQHSQSFILNI